ncbi:MAG: polysaccharide biosynthesis C-terminal domain-containing protein [Cryomorphaceae bacterium]
MSSPLKKLAGQTAIYGLSSILGRFLNYLLTPLYTSEQVFSPDQYGIITEMYAYVAFLVVLLTYGMETAFFRYFSAQKENGDQKVFSTALVSLIATSFAFIAIVSAFAQPIAETLGYPNDQEYISWFGIIVGLDALVAVPLAKLRAENKAFRFAFINIAFIGVNIGLNLFFLAYCLPKYQSGDINWIVETFYDPETGVGYVFIANLIASAVRFVLMLPDMLKGRFRFDKVIWRKMVLYALPLLVAGLAGIVNETLDRAMLKWMLIGEQGELMTMTQLGIYGACYKLSIVITLCIQAYRYAAEPFFFDQAESSQARATYARMLHLFFAFVLFVFLGVTLFIDFFKYFIPNKAYWEGLDIVPVLLLANVFLGVYYNLSVWYKLTDKTKYGSFIAIGGALLTIGLNLALIPVLGFRGSAWATLLCYFSMAAASYLIGQKFYPVPYQLDKLGGYFALAMMIFFGARYLPEFEPGLKYMVHGLLTGLFAIIVYYFEFYKARRDAPSD